MGGLYPLKASPAKQLSITKEKNSTFALDNS